MLRTQNITGPTNATTSGYNNSVQAINKMQKEEEKLLEIEMNNETSIRNIYLQSYINYTDQKNELSKKINQIDGLIKEF